MSIDLRVLNQVFKIESNSIWIKSLEVPSKLTSRSRDLYQNVMTLDSWRFWYLSEVGGKRVCKDRAPQPGGRFVPSVRACAQCYSCRIRDEMSAWSPSLFPFGPGGISFPFSLQYLSVGACLSKSEKIFVNLDESDGGRKDLK